MTDTTASDTATETTPAGTSPKRSLRNLVVMVLLFIAVLLVLREITGGRSTR